MTIITRTTRIRLIAIIFVSICAAGVALWWLSRPPRDHELAAQYAKIELGMSPNQVEAIFARPSEISCSNSFTRPGEESTIVLANCWSGKYREFVIVDFDDQENVVRKTFMTDDDCENCSRSSETLFEKFLGLLGSAKPRHFSLPLALRIAVRENNAL